VIDICVRGREVAETDASGVRANRCRAAALPVQGSPVRGMASRIAHDAVIDHQWRLRPTERLGWIADPALLWALEAHRLRDVQVLELRAPIRRLTLDPPGSWKGPRSQRPHTPSRTP